MIVRNFGLSEHDMRFTIILAAAAVSFTLPAVAQTAPATDVKATPPKEKKTCRRYAVTGSIVGIEGGMSHQGGLDRDRCGQPKGRGRYAG